VDEAQQALDAGADVAQYLLDLALVGVQEALVGQQGALFDGAEADLLEVAVAAVHGHP